MMLSVSDLVFSYHHRQILKKMCFELKAHQLMCILGVNGAGKSTLLKCLNQLLVPIEGAIFVDGENIVKMKKDRIARKMGYVPQYHQRMNLTVFSVVLMGRKPYFRWNAGDRDYRIVESMLNKMGIAHLAMRSVKDLSGGEIQKVAIARALVQSPDILLMDEPTSSLDLKGQLEVMELMKKMVIEEHLSAVVAIHDLNMALRFGDRFLFIKNRKIHGVYRREELTPCIIQDVYDVNTTLVKVGDQTIVVPL